MPSFNEGDAPWQDDKGEIKYMPMQVEIGDQVIFLSRVANKIEYEGKTYFIVPQSGILMIIREEIQFETE
jgi:co-chaperonin GroES (HSP10)